MLKLTRQQRRQIARQGEKARVRAAHATNGLSPASAKVPALVIPTTCPACGGPARVMEGGDHTSVDSRCVSKVCPDPLHFRVFITHGRIRDYLRALVMPVVESAPGESPEREPVL